MKNAVENESDLAKVDPAPPTKKSSTSGFDKFLFGILILGLAALVVYQVFFCPTCYG